MLSDCYDLQSARQSTTEIPDSQNSTTEGDGSQEFNVEQHRVKQEDVKISNVPVDSSFTSASGDSGDLTVTVGYFEDDSPAVNSSSTASQTDVTSVSAGGGKELRLGHNRARAGTAAGRDRRGKRLSSKGGHRITKKGTHPSPRH